MDDYRFKAMRKMLAQFIGTSSAVSVYKDTQEAELQQLLLRLWDRSGDVLPDLLSYVATYLL
jgi:hypothetical protein